MSSAVLPGDFREVLQRRLGELERQLLRKVAELEDEKSLLHNETSAHRQKTGSMPNDIPTSAMTVLKLTISSVQFSHSVVANSVTKWIAACQASLSITNSQSLLKLMSIESVMPSSHLILCRPLLLLPSIFANIGVFSNESALCIRWPKYWFHLQHQSFQ